MTYHFYLFLLGLLAVFFALNLLLLEIGRKIGRRDLDVDPKGAKVGASQVETAIFTLLGLLIAFTFFGASERFEARRHLIVNEADAIATVWYEIDLLPSEFQPKMRDLFRQYTEARLNVTHKLPDIEASSQQAAVAKGIQKEIWKLVIQVNKQNSTLAIPLIVIPSLNAMFDMATSHNLSLVTHPPLIIYLTLIALICICSFFVGYSFAGAKHRKLFHSFGYTFILTGILYVIINFEYPRVGVINIKKFDLPMVELRKEMN